MLRPPTSMAADPSGAAIWNKSFQTSRATLQPWCSNTCITLKWWVSVTHHVISFAPNPPITSVPLSSIVCYGGQGSRRPPGPTWLCLLKHGEAAWSHQAVPILSITFVQHANTNAHTHTHTPANHQSQFSAPHCALPDSLRNVFKLSRPYSNSPGAGNTTKQ